MTVEIKISINANDRQRVDAALGRLAQRAADVGGGLRQVGEALLKEQNRRFQTQTDPDGKPWAKLAPLTVLTRGGATGPILRRRGLLMRSGTYQVAGNSLAVGVSGVQAAVQQFGATIVPKRARMLAIPLPGRLGGRNGPGFALANKVTIPARPMVGFGARDEEAARHAIDDWLRLEGETG